MGGAICLPRPSPYRAPRKFASPLASGQQALAASVGGIVRLYVIKLVGVAADAAVFLHWLGRIERYFGNIAWACCPLGGF